MRASPVHRLERSQLIRLPLERVFEFFADAGNLEAITPPFLRFRINTPAPIALYAGSRIKYTLVLFGVRLRWVTRITVWEPGVRFVDVQESGPYALWRHTHEFERHGDDTLMRDLVEYALPFGLLGSVVHRWFVRRTLARIFDYRSEAITRLLGSGGAGGPAAGTPAAADLSRADGDLPGARA